MVFSSSCGLSTFGGGRLNLISASTGPRRSAFFAASASAVPFGALAAGRGLTVSNDAEATAKATNDEMDFMASGRWNCIQRGANTGTEQDFRWKSLSSRRH